MPQEASSPLFRNRLRLLARRLCMAVRCWKERGKDVTRSIQSGSRMDPSEKGVGLPQTEKLIAEQMIAQANALERRLAMTEHAVALQQRIRDGGVESTMWDVCRIRSDEDLGKLVLERYRKLTKA